MRTAFAIGMFVVAFGLLSAVAGCSKEKPEKSLTAEFEAPAKPGLHISEQSYLELFRIIVDLSPGLRREAVARNLLLSDYKIYGKEISKIFEGMFSASPDVRQELLAREFTPLFNRINRDAWDDLAMVAPARRAEALIESCKLDGKPLVAPLIAQYAEFEFVVLAMGMEYEARKGGFEDEALHRLAMSVMLDPEWFLLYPPPANDQLKMEGPFEPLQPLSVTVAPTAIRLGADQVVDVGCKIDGKDCTGSEVENLGQCVADPESSVCTGVSLVVPPEFKENSDPNSLVISPLQRHLKVRTAGKLEALKALGRVFKGQVTLFIHPAIPYRMLVEVIYSTGSIALPGRNSLTDFRLRTFPQVHERGNGDRRTRLPRYAGEARNRTPTPTVVVSEDRFVIKLPERLAAEDVATAIVLRKEEQPVCGWDNSREEYDFAGLYSKLVELRYRSELGLGDTIHLGAEPGVPWHVVSRVYDTVTVMRAKDTYSEPCEFLDAPTRIGLGTDAEGKQVEVPMKLFPDVVLVMAE